MTAKSSSIPPLLDLDILCEILGDTDPMGFVLAGSDTTVYDSSARIIQYGLHPDITQGQMRNLIWTAFFTEFCCGTIAGAVDQPWEMTRRQGQSVLGTDLRWKGLATVLRDLVRY